MEHIARRRILLFADNDVAKRFHHFGVEVVCAASFTQAMTLLDEQHFDAIMIDPHAQVLAKCEDPFRSVVEHGQGTPLLVLSSEDDKDSPRRALQAGAIAIFNMDRLDPAVLGRFFGLDAQTEQQAKRLLVNNRKLRREIYQRQAVESALRKTEERYRAIFENAPIGIFRAYILGGFEQANPALAAMFGYDSVDDFVTSVIDVGSDTYCDVSLRNTIIECSLRAPGKVIVREVEYKRKDGSTFLGSLRIRTVPTPMGPPYLVEGTIEDLTERRKTENALRRTELKYRELVENLRVGVYSATADMPGRFLTVNPAMAHLFGYGSAEELAAVSPTSLYVAEADRLDFLDQLHRCGSVRHNEMRMRKKNGEIFWTARSVTANVNENGDIVSMDGMVEDISARKQTEDALRKARDNAEEASRLKSDFLSLVSHELRTPLTSILGFTKVLSRKLEHPAYTISSAPPPYKDLLASSAKGLFIIQSEAHRLTGLINDVMDLAQLEAGSIVWDMEQIDMQSVLQHSVNTHKHDFEKKSIALNLIMPSSLPKVNGDAKRLEQVVSNLLSNALKFTDKGSVSVTASVLGSKMLVSVADSGIGIESGSREDIFDAFKQLGDTLTDKPRGTGLGLALCRAIVEHHGGALDVTSMPGLGSVFTFCLPVET
ncbi:hybrid sensor histidine kinase/response regulator [Desulfovibrio inopinatus]|uniref:hybrid sensor histidine kinase/response regulator n=1 Tax=Desulfovibrio inopinatus TaxID=102109 RepID=UPI00040949AA|nr:PAS domain S-box protein [Desulfovibrio inopinatus]